MEEQHLTVDEVAGLLRVSRWSVSRWIKAGALKATKAEGRNGAIRVPVSSYREFIQDRTVTAEETR